MHIKGRKDIVMVFTMILCIICTWFGAFVGVFFMAAVQLAARSDKTSFNKMKIKNDEEVKDNENE